MLKLILRHAWLNLWDKHMTAGRINQVCSQPKTISACSQLHTSSIWKRRLWLACVCNYVTIGNIATHVGYSMSTGSWIVKLQRLERANMTIQGMPICKLFSQLAATINHRQRKTRWHKIGLVLGSEHENRSQAATHYICIRLGGIMVIAELINDSIIIASAPAHFLKQPDNDLRTHSF